MAFCDKCGTELPENTKFCPECGNKTAVPPPEANKIEIESINVNADANTEEVNEVEEINEITEDIPVIEEPVIEPPIFFQQPVPEAPVLTLDPPVFQQPAAAEAPAIPEPAPQPQVIQQIQQPAAPPVFEQPSAVRQPPPEIFNNKSSGEQPPPYGSRYSVMTVGSYIGSTILMNIPVIGWLICIIWAIGAKNRNKRNYARAILIFFLVGAIFCAIVFCLVWFLGDWIIDTLEQSLNDIGIDISSLK